MFNSRGVLQNRPSSSETGLSHCEINKIRYLPEMKKPSYISSSWPFGLNVSDCPWKAIEPKTAITFLFPGRCLIYSKRGISVNR